MLTPKTPKPQLLSSDERAMIDIKQRGTFKAKPLNKRLFSKAFLERHSLPSPAGFRTTQFKGKFYSRIFLIKVRVV